MQRGDLESTLMMWNSKSSFHLEKNSNYIGVIFIMIDMLTNAGYVTLQTEGHQVHAKEMCSI